MVRKLTGGLGADYTFEVYGDADTCELAFSMARNGGTATIGGIAPTGDMPHIDTTAIVRQEKAMKGSYYGSADMYTDMSRRWTGPSAKDGLITCGRALAWRCPDIYQDSWCWPQCRQR